MCNKVAFGLKLDSDEEPMSIIERQQTAAKAKRDAKKKAQKEAEKAAAQKGEFDPNTEQQLGENGEGTTEEEGEEIAEPTILEQFAADKANFEETKLPKWLYKYLVFRFNLLDRTGKKKL